MKKYDVIIVGGGAAGLACAVALSENPQIKILIIEAGERAGKKLSATGNGQGNICNSDMSIVHYRSGEPEVVENIILPDADSSADWACRRIFGALLLKCDGAGRIYPQSMQASSLTDILLGKLKRRGVDILLSTRVSNIRRGFIVNCGDTEFSSDFVVLAAGGKAQKQFRTDGSAYNLAVNFKHSLTPLYPAIVQLKTEQEYIKNLRGIRVNSFVRACVDGECKKEILADIIFTDYGVSGNAAFYCSSALAAHGGVLVMDFLPDFSEEVLVKTLEKRREEGVDTQHILAGIVHNQLARAILSRAGTGDLKKIASMLKNFTLKVVGTLGFDYAQVTQGGIDMKDISDKLESKLCKNLYFAGEILDVDGDCGGYNLHWAFASGITVADDINSKLR